MARTSTSGRAPFDLGPLVALCLFLFLAGSLVAGSLVVLGTRLAWSPLVLGLTLKTGTGRAAPAETADPGRAAPAPARTADASSEAPLPAIDPATPLADLLPPPPKAGHAPVYLGGDLSAVPEVALE